MKPNRLCVFLLVLAAVSAQAAPPNDTAAESKRANEFFDKCFDERVARHPMFESQLGIKTHYDQWDDLSDAQDVAELEIAKKNLATLKRDFDFAKLDAQTQLSYQLFEEDVARDIEGFQFRFDDYPVDQMGGVHSQIPTFLINIHRVDSVKDAEAYVARLNGVSKLFDQTIANLKLRAEKGVVPPKFVFPLVLDACEKVLQGQPFQPDESKKSAILEDFTKKVGALKEADAATKDRLLAEAKKALLESVKPSYEKLAAFLRVQEKTANDDAGAWKFPDGAAFYEFALRRTPRRS